MSEEEVLEGEMGEGGGGPEHSADDKRSAEVPASQTTQAAPQATAGPGQETSGEEADIVPLDEGPEGEGAEEDKTPSEATEENVEEPALETVPLEEIEKPPASQEGTEDTSPGEDQNSSPPLPPPDKPGSRRFVSRLLGKRSLAMAAGILVLLGGGGFAAWFLGGEEPDKEPEAGIVSPPLQDKRLTQQLLPFYVPVESKEGVVALKVSLTVDWDALSAALFKRENSRLRQELYDYLLSQAQGFTLDPQGSEALRVGVQALLQRLLGSSRVKVRQAAVKAVS